MKFIDTRSNFVAIVGKPNVGKSSLLNLLTGQKIAIVTNRPQTTRTRITGVVTKDDVQYVFIDTPGLHLAKNKLGGHMVKTVKESVSDVDVALLVVEPTGKVNNAELDLIKTFKSKKQPAILVINKIDTLSDKKNLMERISNFISLYDFAAVVPISVLKQDGISLLFSEIEKFSTESVHYFPSDTLTDQPERVIISEIVREKILLNLRDEIPHGVAVDVESMKERKNIIDINIAIYCERDNHKGMIIGKNGAMLKKIATAARVDIEKFLQTKINLKCWVKVRENWRNKEGIIRSLGLSQHK